jgi:hypothetical protein
VTRAAGAGKVLYTGIDSTWRWRRGPGDAIYERFWSQVVRWAVAERLSAADDRVRLGTDRLVYEPPLRVTIDALLDDAGDDEETDAGAREQAIVDAVVTAVGKEAEHERGQPWSRRLRLEPIPQSGGRYRGVLVDDSLLSLAAAASGAGKEPRPIECRVELEIAGLPGYNERQDRAAATFVVKRPRNREALDLTRNAALMEELARLSGGAYLPLARYREAVAHIPDRSRMVTRRSVAGILDYPLLIAALGIGLLALEWVLRKRWDLV